MSDTYQALSQSKRICISPDVANESEAHKICVMHWCSVGVTSHWCVVSVWRNCWPVKQSVTPVGADKRHRQCELCRVIVRQRWCGWPTVCHYV